MTRALLWSVLATFAVACGTQQITAPVSASTGCAAWHGVDLADSLGNEVGSMNMCVLPQ